MDASGTAMTYNTAVTVAGVDSAHSDYAWYTDTTPPVAATAPGWTIEDTDVITTTLYTTKTSGTNLFVSSQNKTKLSTNGVSVSSLFTETVDSGDALTDIGDLKYAIETSTGAVPSNWCDADNVYFPTGDSASTSDPKTFYLYAKDPIGNISTTCVTETRGNHWLLDNTGPKYTGLSFDNGNDYYFQIKGTTTDLCGIKYPANHLPTAYSSPNTISVENCNSSGGNYLQLHFIPIASNGNHVFLVTLYDDIGNSREITLTMKKVTGNWEYVSVTGNASVYGAGSFLTAINRNEGNAVTNTAMDGTLYAVTSNDLVAATRAKRPAKASTMPQGGTRAVESTRSTASGDVAGLLERHARSVASASSVVSERASVGTVGQSVAKSGMGPDRQAMVTAMEPLANAFMQKRGVIFKTEPRKLRLSWAWLRVKELAKNVLKTDYRDYRTFIFRKRAIV